MAITAYDRSIYGVLEGSVVGISPDAVAEERTGETFYIVRVRTNESVLRAPGSGQAMPIGSGMVAEVDLIGEKRTILQYLLTPITRHRRNGAQGAIAPGLGQQAGLEPDDPVAPGKRRSAMGDDQDGDVAADLGERVDHRLLRFRVEMAGRLVEDQHGGALVEGARDRDALALAAGQPHARSPTLVS